MSNPLPSSPTSEGREETLSQAGRPMPTDADWAVISAIRHELWQASQGRGYGEDRTLVGMVRRVIAERDEARQNRKGEYELRSTAEQEVVTLRASLTEAQAENQRLRHALRMTRRYNEHAWNCRIDHCKECADLKERMVDLRCEALGDLTNPDGRLKSDGAQ